MVGTAGVSPCQPSRARARPTSEDVSFFLNEMPGLYFNLGIVPRDLPKPRQTTVRAERS
jgi:metal-dependent amidase/aminoacylase/carboxypeptidase family protein